VISIFFLLTISDEDGFIADHSPVEPGKVKKQKGKKKSNRTKAHADEVDSYQPSPILDDFSAHSEGRPPKLDRNFYEKELARLSTNPIV
jgi:hypothetical protein